MYHKSHSLTAMADSKRNSINDHQKNKQVHPIVRAAMNNDVETIQKELGYRDFSNDDYVAAISRAGGHGNIDALKALIESPVNEMADNERAMRWLARHGQLKSLQYFVEDVGVSPACFNSASIRSAAQHNHLDCLIYLHEKGAKLGTSDGEDIKYAVRFYHEETAEFLVKHGVPFSLSKEDFEDNHRRNKVYRSGTRTGDFEIDKWDLFYRVATKGASMHRTLKAMLETGTVSQVGMDTAAIKVASYGLKETYKILREYGADVNAFNVAALSEAARFGHEAMVIHFLDNEPEIDQEVGIQRALKKSIEGNHDKISQKLMHRIDSSKGVAGSPDVLIRRFVRYKQTASAIELINNNPWLSTDTDVAEMVARNGERALLERMVEGGMNLASKTINYVDSAIERHNFKNAEFFIEEGILPDNLNAVMVTSAQFGEIGLLSVALEAGARADFNDSEALTKATQFNHIEAIKLLRAHGAKVSKTTYELATKEATREALIEDKESVRTLTLKDRSNKEMSA